MHSSFENMYNNFWPLRRPHPQGFSWYNKVLFALHEEPELSEERLYVLTRARGRPCQLYQGADAAGEQFCQSFNMLYCTKRTQRIKVRDGGMIYSVYQGKHTEYEKALHEEMIAGLAGNPPSPIEGSTEGRREEENNEWRCNTELF